MAITIFELTPAMVERIVEMTSIPSTEIALQTDLVTLRNSLRNDLLNPATAQSRKIVSGGISPDRDGRFVYVKIDTEALSASDNLDTISPTGYSNFDIIFLRLESEARETVFRDEAVTGLGNMKLKSSTFTMAGNHAYLILMLIGSYWTEVSRSPGMNDLLLTGSQTFTRGFNTVASGILDLTGQSLLVALGEKTGEVLATFEITVGAPGAAGDIDCILNEGTGDFSIGAYSYSGSPTQASVRAAYTLAINAGTLIHGYVATDTGVVISVAAPVGSGAGANGYITTLVPEGDSVAAITTAIAGGVDGANSADTITDISGIQYNQECRVINGMTGSANILTFQCGIGNINGATTQTYRIKPGESLGIIADESGNASISWHPADPCCRCVTVTLTQAQINALNTVPIQGIPAPLANEFIIPESILVTSDYNGTAYATWTTLEIYFPSAMTAIASSPLLNSTSDVFREMTVAGLDENSLSMGEALMIREPNGNPTGAGSTFKVHISYRIVAL